MVSSRHMGPRRVRIGASLALAAVAAVIGCVGPSSAFAKAETKAAEWYMGTSESALSTLKGTQTLTVEFGESEFGKKGTVATNIFGVTWDSTTSAVKCIECVITNEGTKPGVATGYGKLEFSEVVTMEPAACKVKEGKIVTNKVLIEAHYMQGENNYVRLSPYTGETFTTTNIEGCAVAGSYPSKGTIFALATNKTGVSSVAPAFRSSAAINTEAGGSLTLGSQPAAIVGTLVFKDKGNFLAIK
jgi:hypothetical protein